MSFCPVGLSSAATRCVSVSSEYDSSDYVRQYADEPAAAVLYYVQRRKQGPVWRLYGIQAIPDSNTIYLIDASTASMAQYYYVKRRQGGMVWVPVIPVSR